MSPLSSMCSFWRDLGNLNVCLLAVPSFGMSLIGLRCIFLSIHFFNASSV